jgi:hypothetical protein
MHRFHTTAGLHGILLQQGANHRRLLRQSEVHRKVFVRISPKAGHRLQWQVLPTQRDGREDSQDKNNPERRADLRQEVLFCEEGLALEMPEFSFVKIPYPSGPAAALATRAGDIFHPPA